MAESSNSGKNILVIAGGNYISGAEKVTLDVIQGLKNSGHRLTCAVSGWTDGEFIKQLSDMKVGFRKFKLGWYYLTNLKWSVDSLIHYPGAFLDFYQFSKATNFDLVYTMSFRYLVLLYPILRNNVIYHVHDPNSHSRQSRFFIKKIDRKVVKYIAVSDFIKKDLIKCGISAGKIEVIHNGTNVIEDKRLVVGKQGNDLAIGIVGQVIQRKGHEDLIEALKILRDQNLNVSLIIVGKGSKSFIGDLKELISKYNLASCISWRTFKSDIHEIYEGIDVIVAPTRNDEPFALIALEANMLSIPVIATNKGGFPESINDGVNGFLVKANSPEQIAEKICTFYNDRSLITKFGNNGRSRMIERFTKQKMIAGVNELITIF